LLVDLKSLVDRAAGERKAIAAFNVFGYEDSIAVVRAAEQLGAPVILAANIPALQHMPLEYLAPILLQTAKSAAVPICVHLDHGKDYDYVAQAIRAGFTSVMFDGSQLPLEHNIEKTREIVKLARESGVSVEAEIGSVGYSDPSIKMKHEYSDPEEVKAFVDQTGIDAVAVAVGTVHRMETQTAAIDFERLARIQSKVDIPLVIHGSTGVGDDDLRRLTTHRVGKINIGTAIRMAFGKTLREEILQHPDVFDRIRLFQKPMQAVQESAVNKLKILGFGSESHDN
jgi:fructose-bisphosphate aldolase class II